MISSPFHPPGSIRSGPTPPLPTESGSHPTSLSAPATDVYHAWPADKIGATSPGRLLWLDRLEWRDGKPFVHGPTCRRQPAL